MKNHMHSHCEEEKTWTSGGLLHTHDMTVALELKSGGSPQAGLQAPQTHTDVDSFVKNIGGTFY